MTERRPLHGRAFTPADRVWAEPGQPLVVDRHERGSATAAATTGSGSFHRGREALSSATSDPRSGPVRYLTRRAHGRPDRQLHRDGRPETANVDRVTVGLVPATDEDDDPIAPPIPLRSRVIRLGSQTQALDCGTLAGQASERVARARWSRVATHHQITTQRNGSCARRTGSTPTASTPRTATSTISGYLESTQIRQPLARIQLDLELAATLPPPGDKRCDPACYHPRRACIPGAWQEDVPRATVRRVLRHRRTDRKSVSAPETITVRPVRGEPSLWGHFVTYVTP